jgi:catechol 2,3-dioxygenase-like lactoylglutathione lyase family enzyme
MMRVIVNIDVPELASAIDFYTAALGLTPSRILDDDVAELTGASSVIYLLRHPPASDPVGSNPVIAHAVNARPLLRQYARHWTPVHMDFVVDDVVRTARRAQAAGAIQEGDCIEWRGSKCMSFSDPFGHGFCLIEFADGTYAGEDA